MERLLTVQEVWRRALPRAAKLLAGASRLDRPISYPVLMRARAAAFGEIHGNELAIVPLSLLPFVEGQPSLRAVVSQLARADVSAMLVLGQPDERAVQLAEDVGLPLFALDGDPDPREVQGAILQAIAALNDELYQRGQELYRSLTELVIQQRGLDALVERLAQLARRPVAFEDETPSLQHWARGPAPAINPPEELVRKALADQAEELLAWSAGARLNSSDPPTTTLVFNAGMARVVAPVVVPGTPGAMPVAWVSVFGRPAELGAIDALVAARGAAACAIALSYQRSMSEAEQRGRRDFLDELLAGTLNAEALALNAARLRVRLDEPHTALALRAAGPGAAEARLARLRRALEVELERRAPGSLTAERVDHVLAVVPAPTEPQAPARLIDGLVGSLQARLRGLTVSAGVGRAYPGASGIRSAYREAQQALAIGEALFGEGRLTRFADLGLYRLLFALPDGDELLQFYDETLRPLVERDERGELLHTLETYLAVNGSATRAAELLNLHRNSLAYRLRRIEEITGADLEDAERRLTFQVALRARSVLRARGLL